MANVDFDVPPQGSTNIKILASPSGKLRFSFTCL